MLCCKIYSQFTHSVGFLWSKELDKEIPYNLCVLYWIFLVQRYTRRFKPHPQLRSDWRSPGCLRHPVGLLAVPAPWCCTREPQICDQPAKQRLSVLCRCGNRILPSCRNEQQMRWRRRRWEWWDLWRPRQPGESRNCRIWPNTGYRSQLANMLEQNGDIVYILRKRRIPSTVLNAQAISTIVDILRWGDSWTVWGVWTCRLEIASVWGRIQVEIIRANMWTAIRRTVQTAKETSKPCNWMICYVL